MNKNKLILLKNIKIVATIGPVSENEKVMKKMAQEGMNVVRLNFSHGNHAEHATRINIARKVSKDLNKPIAILQDLSGPKIRIGDFYKEYVHLKKGSTFTLTTKKIIGDENNAYINYKQLPKQVKKGNLILLDDGKKKLKVQKVSKDKIICIVVNGGKTKGRRGVNIPGANLKINAITAKDKKDLEFGLKKGVDFVALSFVRGAKDVKYLRTLLKKYKSEHVHIIAKIETMEAIENIDAIIKEADGIMVARGDLAIEVPAQDVPILQKTIIDKCHQSGKPVIVATQMLESMIHSSVPTRAEVSDVANAILDGADAIMLSEETTLGEYPIETIQMMTSIAQRMDCVSDLRQIRNIDNESLSIVDSITRSAVSMADEVNAKAIVALTESGFTARMISRFKPKQTIIALTPNNHVRNQSALLFGCYSEIITDFAYVVDVIDDIKKIILNKKVAQKGDRIIILAGIPFGKSGNTNMNFIITV